MNDNDTLTFSPASYNFNVGDITSMSFGQPQQEYSIIDMMSKYGWDKLKPIKDDISNLQTKLQQAEDDKLTRSQKKLLQKRIDANQALLDAGGDSKLLSKKQQRYLGDDSEVTQNLEEHKEKIANTTNLLSTGFNLVGSAFGQDNSMNGPGAQSAGVQATSALLKMGKEEIGKALPWAKVGFAANDALTNMFGGTDGEAVPDVIASNIPLISIANAVLGKKSNPLVKDTESLAYLDGGYDATEGDITEAAKHAGKKFGFLSNKARHAADRNTAKAKAEMEIMGDIAYDTQQDRLTESSMTDIFSNLQSFKSAGGWNSRATYLVKQGGKLFSDSTISNVRSVLKHQNGNKITKTRSLQELIDYAKQANPRFIQRLSEPARGIVFTDDSGNKSAGSHVLEWIDSDGKAIIYPRIQEVDNGLQFLNSEDAYKRALDNKNYLEMSPEEAKIFFSEDKEYGTAYKTGWPKFFQEWKKLKFQNGGKFNVIPDGALHARLHHLDIDGITNKGIPVVVQKKGGEVEQQAEVERNEIIFNLDTTKKLEALWKDGSDEAAIEAGKLLVSEILENTIDNTGLLKEV